MNAILPMAGTSGALRPFLGFATDPDSRRAIAMAAAARGWAMPEVAEGGLDAAHARLATGPAPGFLVVDLSAAKAPLPEVDALAELCDSETRVIAIGTRNDVALYRGLRALGVSDYLLKPIDHETLGAAINLALQTAEPPAPAQAAPRSQASLIALVGTRGGAGTSALAAALAQRMAASGLSTVLVDLDFQAGSLALDLDLEPSAAIAPLLETPERLDPVVVAQALRPHASGFRLLAADEAGEAGDAAGPDAILALLAAAGADADVVLVDVPRWLDPARRTVLRIADRLVLVTPLTLAGLRDTQRMTRLSTALRAGQRPILVASRAGAQAAELDPQDFAACLGSPLDAVLPEDPRAARAAAETATTLADHAAPALARPLADLAQGLQPADVRVRPEARRAPRAAALLARLFGRRGS